VVVREIFGVYEKRHKPYKERTKQEIEAQMAEWDEEERAEKERAEKEETERVETQWGVDMTYAHFLEMVGDSKYDVAGTLNEPSLAHVYEKLLNNEYSWAPKDLVLNEENTPKNRIQGNEESFKPMLRDLNPSDRQRADRLHNLVHQPDTEEYLERYHSTDNAKFATDSAGTTELFNDWGVAYEKGVDQVTFNGQIHRQMSFGASSDV